MPRRAGHTRRNRKAASDEREGRVRIEGLKSRPDLNGKEATVLHWSEAENKWAVRCAGSEETEFVVSQHLIPLESDADAATITEQRLNLVKNASTATNGTVECAICLEEIDTDSLSLQVDASLRQLGCGHVFHTACWKSTRATKCPMCRSWNGERATTVEEDQSLEHQWWQQTDGTVIAQIAGYVYQARWQAKDLDPSAEEELAFIGPILRRCGYEGYEQAGRRGRPIGKPTAELNKFTTAYKTYQVSVRVFAALGGTTSQAGEKLEDDCMRRMDAGTKAGLFDAKDDLRNAITSLFRKLIADTDYHPYVDQWLVTANLERPEHAAARLGDNQGALEDVQRVAEHFRRLNMERAAAEQARAEPAEVV